MESPASASPSSVLPATQPPSPKLGWWARRRQRKKNREALAKGFDLGWLALLLFTLALLSQQFWIDDATVRAIVTYSVTGCAAGLSVYLGHILLARLQCSLLEFLALIFLLGNVMGILLTTPSFFYIGWRWMLTLSLFLLDWVLLGAVAGLTHARILGVDSQFKRLLFIVGAWLIIAARACLLAGLLLCLPTFVETQLQNVIGARLMHWGPVLLVIGVAGIIVHLVIAHRVKRAARKILNET